MVPHRMATIRSRAAHISAASAAVLLGAMLLGACGASTGEGGDPSQVALNMPATTTEPGSQQASATAGDAPPSPHGTPPGSAGSPTPETGPDVGPPGSVQAPATTTSVNGSTSSIGRCHTSMLDASLSAGHPGAGQRYAELTLVNSGGQTCRLYGYPGLQLVGAEGEALPTDVERTSNRDAHTVKLSPGESSSTLLHWGVVPTGDEPATEPCQPDPQRLRVIPPDETDSLVLDWPFGPVCGRGHIFVKAFH